MTASSSDNAHTVTAANGMEIHVPEEYVCPLTMDIMRQPLMSKEGHNYERDDILNWVVEHGTSPLTREPMRVSDLVRNRTLEIKINFFLKQYGIADHHDDNEQDEATVDKMSRASSKFVGCVVSDDTVLKLAVRRLSLENSNAADTASLFLTTLGDEHVVTRRREIANLIDRAIRDLQDI